MNSTLVYLFLICSLFSAGNCYENTKNSNLDRSCFPKGFVFGAASSAYQYEGASCEDGRKPSIWDEFIQKYPGISTVFQRVYAADKIADKSSGAVAVDFYHRYKGEVYFGYIGMLDFRHMEVLGKEIREDVGIMKDMGLDSFRFSISWPRVLPNGNLKGGVNQKGIDFYNNVIDELMSHGIKPFVTIFHWDVPQALEDEYGGFLSSKIVNDYREFAELCFSKFGDRVKHWITLNEPSVFLMGYTDGSSPPGRCSKYISTNCTGGDSSREPYKVIHNELRAHAAAVQVYRQKYQKQQNGAIGITLNSEWVLPLTDTTEDKAAADRAMAFRFGCFMEPLKSGKYPKEMKSQAKKRLPKFSNEESSLVKGSYDFIGINYYSSYYASDSPCPTANLSFNRDSCFNSTFVKNGVAIGPRAASEWLYVYPRGIYELLRYTQKKYNDPIIYITENGFSDYRNDSIQDDMRVQYYKEHIFYVQKAIRKGVKVKGYFAWSLLDNFEWSSGYTVRFGMVYVDYANGLKRSLKKSAEWYKKFLAK